jgi:hypothetical protein
MPLPRALRLHWLMPMTVVAIIVMGFVFTLPPGPLSDEGMILFMEGGCDWGDSNIFFFSKLGLLLAINFAFIVAWRHAVRSIADFATWSDSRCDTYYSHPNGSVGQMVVEMTAFGVLGLMVLRRWSGGPIRLMYGALVAWNGLHVALFYLWLTLFNHWTWAHTVGLTVSMLAVGVAILVSGQRGVSPAI